MIKNVLNKLNANNFVNLILHGSNMLTFAFENINSCDKSFINKSVFSFRNKKSFENQIKQHKNKNRFLLIDFVYTAMDILKQLSENSSNDAHVVQEGETLSSIAYNYGIISWEYLYEENKDVIGDNPERLNACTELKIPQNSMNFDSSLLKDGQEWQQKMDEYINTITAMLSYNQIILIRTTIPSVKVNIDMITPFSSDNNTHINIAVKQLEEYFINKVSPYVIDISPHYFLDKNHKYPESNVCFEPLYNQDLLNQLYHIITKQPEKKEFNTANYEYTLHRFLQFYENLYHKNMMSLLLDKEDWLDNIVLNMSKNVITDNLTYLCCLKTMEYHSYEDILTHFDRLENPKLKEIVIVIIHLLKGDICNQGLDYSILYKLNLKVKADLARQVDAKLKQLSLSNEIAVNAHSVPIYHEVLLLYVKKQYKKAMALLLSSYYNQTKPMLVDIWGSCISREPMNLSNGNYQVNCYVYRCCCLSEFDEPLDTNSLNILQYYPGGKRWYKRCFKHSLEKESKIRIMNSTSKWMVVDLFDIINDLAVYKNCIIDFSEDSRNTPVVKKILHECIPFHYYDKPDDYIKVRIDKFIELLKQKYNKNLILVNFDVKEYYLDSKRKIQRFEEKGVDEKKRFVDKWQKYFYEQTGCYCIDIAKYFLADELSVHGAFIVHYEKAFNQEVYHYIDHIIQKEPEQKMFDDYSESLKVERLIELNKNNEDLSCVEALFSYSEHDKQLFHMSLDKLIEKQKQEGLQYNYLQMQIVR